MYRNSVRVHPDNLEALHATLDKVRDTLNIIPVCKCGHHMTGHNWSKEDGIANDCNFCDCDSLHLNI